MPIAVDFAAGEHETAATDGTSESDVGDGGSSAQLRAASGTPRQGPSLSGDKHCRLQPLRPSFHGQRRLKGECVEHHRERLIRYQDDRGSKPPDVGTQGVSAPESATKGETGGDAGEHP